MIEDTYSPASDVEVPKYSELMWPALLALRQLGNSGSIQEIDEKVADILRLSPQQMEVLHKGGPRTKVSYRLAWARTYLKKVGAIDNTGRGIWAVTERSKEMTEDDVLEIPAKVRAMFASSSQDPKSAAITSSQASLEDESDDQMYVSDTSADGYTSTDPDVWKSILVETLLAMSPEKFERLCQRVLREAGFTRVKVTGRKGDGGIDGVGVLRVALLSFHVFFQCKRYRGSVGASAIRDFRGAMVGRTDKGLFITTGTFTPDAVREATRDGAPALDLIDGDSLAGLLQAHNLGISTRQVEEVTIHPEYFESF